MASMVLQDDMDTGDAMDTDIMDEGDEVDDHVAPNFPAISAVDAMVSLPYYLLLSETSGITLLLQLLNISSFRFDSIQRTDVWN